MPRSIAAGGRQLAGTADETKSAPQLDRDVIAAVEQSSNAIARRVRHNIERWLSVLVGAWLAGTAALGVAVGGAGHWLATGGAL